MKVHSRGYRPPLRRRSRALAVGLLGSLALVGCGEEEPVAAPPPVRAVKMLEVGTQGLAVTREYPGQITAATEAEVAFEVGGRIVELPVVQGQRVREGDLLARLDPRDYQAELDASIAQRNAALADYERFQELLGKDAVSQRDFETRKRNWEVAEASLRISQKSLDDTTLVAPFSGRVARKYVDRFQNIQAKEPILLLQDATRLEIDVSLPEADLLRWERGVDPRALSARLQPVVAVSSIPGEAFPARLTELATAADPTTRTFTATFAFEAPSAALILPGMTAVVRMGQSLEDATSGSPGFAIPARATVIGETGDAFVFKVDPATMTVSKVRVELGELSGESVLVVDGLERDDLIATTGASQLREGMQVRRLQAP